MTNLLAAALHFAFSLVCWLHAHTARPLVEWWDDTVLGVWEESVKSVVREAFVQTYRFLNGASAWVLSVFDTNYAESLRSSWKQQQDWHSWWAEDRQSTLNAVVTKYVPPQPQQQRRSGNSDAQARADGASTSKGAAITTPQHQQQHQHQTQPWQQNPSAATTTRRAPGSVWQRAGSFVSGSLRSRRSSSGVATAMETPVHIIDQELRSPLQPESGFGRGISQQAPLAAVHTHQAAAARMPFQKSVVFEQPAGWGVHEGVKRTGLLEDLRLMAELCVTRVFDAMRMIVRAVTFTPKASSPLQRAQIKRSGRFPSRSKSAGAALYAQGQESGPARRSGSLDEPRPQQPQLRRAHSSSGWEGPAAVPAMAPELSSASQIIKLAGYPLELHEVVTDDGYILSMERIPRRGSRDVVFFMHGILDTSLTWVSSGVTGSQAFAAWDQGFDVWLGNSRSNPPRAATDPTRQGVHYWHYTNNELGIYDMSSQVDHIHETKCQELRSSDSCIDIAPVLDTRGRPSSAAVSHGVSHHGSGVLPLGTNAEKLFASGGTATAAAAGNGSGGVGSLPLPPRLKTSVSDSKLENLDERARAGVGAPEQMGSGIAAPVHVAASAGTAGMPAGCGSDSVNAQAGTSMDAKAPGVERYESGSGRYSSGGLGFSGALPDVSEQAGENWEDVSQRAGVGAMVAGAASRLFGSRGSRGSGSDLLQEQEQQQQRRRSTDTATSKGPDVVQEEQMQLGQQGEQKASQRQPQQHPQRSRLQLFGWGSGSSVDTAASGDAAGASSSGKASSAKGGGDDAAASPGVANSGTASPNACQPTTPQATDSPFRLANDMSSPPASVLRLGGEPGSSSSSSSTAALPLAGDGGSSAAGDGGSSTSGSAAGSPTALQARSSGEVFVSAGSESSGASGSSPRSSHSGSIGALADAVAAMFGSRRHQQQQQQLLQGEEEQHGDSSLRRRPQQSQGSTTSSSSATASGGMAAASAVEALRLVAADSVERAALDAMPLDIMPSISRATSGRMGHQQGMRERTSHDSTQQQQHGRPAHLQSTSPQQHQQGQGASAGAAAPPAAVAAAPGANRMAAAQAAEAAAADARLLDAHFSMRRSQSSQAVFSLDTATSDALPRQRSGNQGPLDSSQAHNAPWGVPGGQPRSRNEPYNLRVVAHSLGGASMLMYLVMRYKAAQPHHVRRLVLLTPAGYHVMLPWALRLVAVTLPYIMRAAGLVWKGAGGALYIPTFIARLLTFKIGLDANRLPALAELLRQTAQGVLGGDRSAWERALQQPHYNAHAMPAVSLHQGLHLAQWVKTGAFTLYNYGSRAANMAHYGLPFPPDVGEEYWRIDIPVDISAGIHDGIIPVANARKHYSHMRAAGVRVTYREFDYGHMDFTFSNKDELRYYVMGRLLRRG